MSVRRKIGILGGTFDPIHDAHLRLGHDALDKLGLDQIVFMPTGNSYFKSGKQNITDAVHRAAMVKLAIEDEPRFIFSDMEIKRHGETYTAETLEQLASAHPDIDFHFIMGADSLRDIDRWYKPDVIFRNAVIVVANRNHQVEDQRLNAEIEYLSEKYNARIIPLDFTSMNVSSSDIRACITNDACEKLPIPKNVISYIRCHRLYGLGSESIYDTSEYTELSFEEIHDKLRSSIKPGRYLHTLGVAETAVDIAKHYGNVPVNKAYLAAILHDCGKEAGDALAHAGIGAELAASVYGVHDAEILSAIACHTTGKADMSELDKIIFIADYIEPGRDKAPNLAYLRQRAYEDLDDTIVLILKDTLSYLESIGAVIDEQSLITYNFYNK